MGYELNIRPLKGTTRAQPEPDHLPDETGRETNLPENPRVLLTKLGVKDRAQEKQPNPMQWTVERPFGKMAITPAPDGRVGVDCTIPEGLLEKEARQFMELVLAAALAVDMVVFDPQLGRIVAQADMEAMVAQWRRFNRYRLQTVGSEPSDMLTGGAFYPEYESPTRPSTVLWLTVAGLFLFGLILVRMCT